MTRSNRFRMSAFKGISLAAMLSFLATPGMAFGESTEEFRSTLLRLHDFGTLIKPGNEKYRTVLESADHATLDALRGAMGDTQSLSISLEFLEQALPAGSGQRGEAPRQKVETGSSMQNIIRGDPNPWSPAMPAYPASPGGVGNYATFTLTLEGLGALVDSDGDGRLNDERCGADYEAGLAIAAAVTGSIDSLSVACAALPPIADKVCYVAAAAVAASVAAVDIATAQCALQDALVDSAEIEAGFENTVVIYDQLLETGDELSQDHDALFTDLEALSAQHVSVLDGQAQIVGDIAALDASLSVHDSDVKAAIATHDGDLKSAVASHDADLKNAVANHDTQVKTAIATHDGDVKSAVATHDTDVKSALATLDGDLKALLATLQAAVDANNVLLQTSLARQLETIRLLNTPQGRRSTEVPACDGAGCAWPNGRPGN